MATFRTVVSNTGLVRTITPQVGDLLLMFVAASGNTNNAPTCTDGNTGGADDGSYTLIDCIEYGAGAHRGSLFVRNHLIPNTTNTTATAVVGAVTNTFTALIAISGMTLAGADAIRGFGVQENQGTGTTPHPVLSVAALTDNLTITAHYSPDFSTTPPTGWTERLDNGAVNAVIEFATRDSGYTGTGDAFGAATTGGYAAAIVELDTSAGGPDIRPSVVGSRIVGSPVIPKRRNT